METLDVTLWPLDEFGLEILWDLLKRVLLRQSVHLGLF